MTGGIVLGLDATLLASGVRAEIGWDYIRFPHAVVFGATGSGKTYFTRLLLAKIGKWCRLPAQTDTCAIFGGQHET